MKILKSLICLFIGHYPGLNGQSYKEVRCHRIDGTTSSRVGLVEEEWCSRCREKLSEKIVNASHDN